MKKKLFASMLSIVMCLSVMVGSTYAIFTSESKVNIAVTSGTVSVVAFVRDVELYSMDVKQSDLVFENGGTATIDGGDLSLAGVSAGDKAIVTIGMKNDSDATIKYCIEADINGVLKDMLVVKKVEIENGADKYVDLKSKTSWAELSAGQAIEDLRVSIELPVDNELANGVEGQTNISIKVIALQGNAPIVSTWDGKSVHTDWFTNAEVGTTEFEIKSASALVGLASLVDDEGKIEEKLKGYPEKVADDGVTKLPVSKEDLTFKLTCDVDLEAKDENGNPIVDENGDPISFDPIGDDIAFTGTFDGQGHTISNLYQSGWAFGYEWGKYGSVGLFGEIENATIKNLTISGAESYIEGGDIGGITGSATGTCVFENVKIEDSVFATYNNGNGGIIGWSGAGTYTFKNVEIAEDVVLAGLWGSFDSSIGGIRY